MCQKRRAVDVDRYKALQDKVERIILLNWLANPVLVIKPNEKWRACIDFTNLNKACPKDSYPLPRINQQVDETAGHELLSFMDAYSEYN